MDPNCFGQPIYVGPNKSFSQRYFAVLYYTNLH